ncbi:GNAT family N-acetyltransferase [Thalassotalea ganghwensis]
MNIPNSERLSYRLMDESDADLFFELDQDPEVMRYLSGGKVTSREDIDNVFMPRMRAYRDEKKGWGIWQVNTKENNEFLGFILVRPMYFFSDHTEFDNLELGWRFFRKTWGMGYASEAAIHIKNHFAQDKSYKAFSAIASEENLASVGVMKKIGMEYVKTYYHEDPVFTCDVVYYQMKNQ